VRIDVTPPGYSGEDVEKAGIVMHVRLSLFISNAEL
jgi:hypothetical protein